MSNTGRYRAPQKSVEWTPTKYDGFKLVKNGEYRQQKGSGRSQCFELAKDGMLIGTWTKKCAEIGFESKFPVNCLQKLLMAKAPAWTFSEKNQDGLTYDEVLHSRSEDRAKEKKEKAAKPKTKKRKSKKEAEEATAA